MLTSGAVSSQTIGFHQSAPDSVSVCDALDTSKLLYFSPGTSLLLHGL